MSSITAEELASLGFTKMAAEVQKLKNRKRKMAIACEHFRAVKPEHVIIFEQLLRERTRKKDGSYKTLEFCCVDQYEKIPPVEVLNKLKDARGLNCFDWYEIAYIKEVKDPILFGRINESSLRFAIADWGDDVNIRDLLKENEG